MKFKKNKINWIVLLIVVLFFCVFFTVCSKCYKYERQIAIWINWNIRLPLAESIYTYEESKITYQIYHLSTNEKKRIEKQLIKQKPSEIWKNKVAEELDYIDIPRKKQPPFDKVDYCIKKVDGLSYIYVFYESLTSKIYVYEFVD